MQRYSSKTLAKRLELIESVLEQAGLFEEYYFPYRPDPIVDPPPWQPSPVDPSPWDIRHIDKVLHERIDHILKLKKDIRTDPPPDDFLNVRLGDLVRFYRGDRDYRLPGNLSQIRLRDLMQFNPKDEITDPAPMDIKHLTVIELENQLHKVNAELVRLESLKGLFSDRLKEVQGAVKAAKKKATK